MWVLKRAEPVAVAVALTAVVTAVLWFVRQTVGGEQHLVFFYLLPMALVAVLYGSVPSMLCAAVATLCAAYFLYDPVYSFYVADPLDWGELICFAGLALFGAKCTADLLQPTRDLSRRHPEPGA